MQRLMPLKATVGKATTPVLILSIVTGVRNGRTHFNDMNGFE